MRQVNKTQIASAGRNLAINYSVLKTLITSWLAIFSFASVAQSVNTSIVNGSPFCAGNAVTVPYTISGTFTSGNKFTAQLSDASGSFASPTAIGNVTSTAAGNINATLPTNTLVAGTGYRIRVVSSNPATVGTDNAFNLTINVPTVSAPTFSSTSFCQTEAFTITVSSTCNFFTGNVFTAQLSDATGSFTSPTTVGTRTSGSGGTISATIPAGTPAGIAYRIRLVSSNPSITTADNGMDLTVSAPSGTPGTFGNGFWNVYCYSGNAFNFYTGYYTENTLNYNTQTRWGLNLSPSSADNSTGLAYAGCVVPIDNHSYRYMRTNFTCGYYQIDIPSHDDDVTLFINGTQVFVHNGCCDAHTNVWTGFLGATSTVEVKQQEGSGQSYSSINFSAAPNPLTLSAPVTVCSGTPTTLTASSPLTLNYSWSPNTNLNTNTGSSVIASPISTTTYTATGTDPSTSCSVSKSVLVTVSNTPPSLTISSTLNTICSGVSTTTLTASGANTYTWSPSTGLSATTGNTVTANPPSTTTYTITGSTNCNSASTTKQITVETIPGTPTPTTFGSGMWNVFCHNSTAFNNYYGYYTENNLSFNTATRWNQNVGPTAASNATGLAYSGCTIPATNYSMSFKRTNIPCGYYQIDIPSHDDNLTIFVNGTQVFQHNACCDSHTNAWSGFLNPSSTVEFQLINFTGPGSLQATFTLSSPLTLSPPVTICQGTSTTLTASSSISGATYAWTPNNGSLATPSATTTVASPTTTTTYTNTITDAAGTGCTASSTVLVTVNPLPTTTVTPTSATITCPTSSVTLTASGANTYSWTPSTGLSASTGASVTANPATTTTYTVTGNNNCSSNTATSTITVIPLPSTSIYPTGNWNVYCYSATNLTGYQGYYTENGSGASGYDFNTTTRWTSGAAPSTANNTNGNAYVGCTMAGTNISLSFKRTGFACGIYKVNVLNHDDGFVLIINGTQVAQHTGAGDAHNAIWTGALNVNSQVELQLVQGTGGSILSVEFVPVTQPSSQSTWVGTSSSDWFTTANWCGGGGVPVATADVLIPGAGPQNMPVINNTGAACKSLTINGAVSAGTYNTALPAASLTVTGAFNLDVNGGWNNSGTFTPGTGTINFTGSGAGSTITSSAIESFYNMIINKPGNITISSGIHQITHDISFSTGVVFQNGGLEILNGATATGASNSSYVNGNVKKVGTNAFTFPVGASNTYRPISISAPATATDHFTAQYIKSNPGVSYTKTSKDPSLVRISAAEYWILNRTGGSSNVTVTLTWNTASQVGYLTDLRIARWDASTLKWKDQGNGLTTGTITAGTIVSNGTVNSFSPFTLGSISDNNPLPVELIEFNCKPGEGVVDLSWKTATEWNNHFFTVERSPNSKDFHEVGRVQAVGNSRIIQSYSLRDSSAVKGITYYRLSQTDLDGTITYLSICSSRSKTETTAALKIYPNPSDKFLFVDLKGIAPTALKVTNNLGEVMYAPFSYENDKAVINLMGISSGLYILELYTSTDVYKSKIIVAH